jgi:hypothetical protein
MKTRLSLYPTHQDCINVKAMGDAHAIDSLLRKLAGQQHVSHTERRQFAATLAKPLVDSLVIYVRATPDHFFWFCSFLCMLRHYCIWVFSTAHTAQGLWTTPKQGLGLCMTSTVVAK